MLKTPYYYQYNAGIEQQIGKRGNLRADFVGTRGLHEPYQVQLNGYQTVCEGCFAPFPYQRPLDQRFGNVNEFRTDANSNYAGLQTAYTQQWGGLTLRGNYTLSHCLDEVSNGGLLGFSTQALMSPLPGELRRQYASCDYDVRHNISGVRTLPDTVPLQTCRAAADAWRMVVLGDRLPALRSAVQCAQPAYIANGRESFKRTGPAPSSSTRPNMPTGCRGCRISQDSISGVTVAGTRQWLNPDAFVSVVDPTTGDCTGATASNPDNPAICQFGNSGRNSVRGPHYTNSDIYVTKTFPIREGISFRFDAQMFNAFNHPNFALPSDVQAGVPGSVPSRFGTLESTIAPPTGLLGVGLGGDSSPRMIAFQGRIEF